MTSSDNFLKDWLNIRKKLRDLEKKEELYRKKVEKEMNSQRSNSLQSRNYVVARRKVKRGIIKKANVPKNIWDKYSEEIGYYTYNVYKK